VERMTYPDMPLPLVEGEEEAGSFEELALDMSRADLDLGGLRDNSEMGVENVPDAD